MNFGPVTARRVATLAAFAAVAMPPARMAGAQDAGAAAPVRAAPGGTLTAADSILEARTTALASGLRCVVCQGLSIQDSPSELAQQMRSVVRDQLAAGRSEREVKAYFISKYGEWILLSPEPRGFNILVYALPILVLAGGFGLVAFKVRRWTAAAAADGSTSGNNDASDGRLSGA